MIPEFSTIPSPLMLAGPHYFGLPDACPRKALIQVLRDELHLDDEGRGGGRRQYLDSADWRIARAGYLLELEPSGDTLRLSRRALGGAARPLTVTVDAMPRTAADVNAANLSRWLGDRLGLRALLPIAEIDTRVQRFALRDAEGKQRVRIEIQQDRLRNGAPLGRRLLVEPLRGYETDADALLAALRTHWKLKPLGTDPFFIAVAASGRRIGDYDQKVDFQLDPYEPSERAARGILATLLTTMERNEAGILACVDTEFLHDFRVAVRRSRSLATQVKGLFAPRAFARFKDDLGWLGQITGPARDLDVYLLDFAPLQAELPEAQRPHLDPLRTYLERQHAAAYKALATQLRSARYRRFRADFRRFLNTRAKPDPRQPNALRPVRHVADERIWRLYRLALREGGAIAPDSPNDDLHELRKTAKKLRYLLEFFRSLYPPLKLDANIKALKKLQDFLGLFQDLEVQSETLHAFEAGMREVGLLPPETEAAIESLVAHMLARQAAMRDEFAVLFAGFASEETQSHYRELFAPARSTDG